MPDITSIDFLRILVPNLADFWARIFEGAWAMRVPFLVYMISWVLVVLGLVFIAYEVVLTQSLAPAAAKGVRLLIAGSILSFYPTLLGGAPNLSQAPPPTAGQAWRAFHSIYAGIYEGSNSFYARWLIGSNGNGPLAQALRKMTEAYRQILLYRGAVIGIEGVVDAALNSVPILNVGCDTPIGEAVTRWAPVINGLCFLKKKAQEMAADFDRSVSRTMHYFSLSILVLMGTHAAIIYATTVIFFATILLLPLAAAMAVFRGGEKLLVSFIGLYFASFLALGVSAVGFGATSYVLYNTMASIWSKLGLKTNEDVEKILTEQKARIKELRELQKAVEVALNGGQNILGVERAKKTYETYYQEAVLNGPFIDPQTKQFVRDPNPPWRIVSGSGEIAYLTGVPTPGASPPLTLITKTCPGTAISVGTTLNPAPFEACFQQMAQDLQVLNRFAAEKFGGENLVQGMGFLDRAAATMLRIALTVQIMLGAVTVLTGVLASTMVLLTVRITSVVQGFKLGEGVGFGTPR